jgi:glycosyltransferase involved in cell wall biosynthesis
MGRGGARLRFSINMKILSIGSDRNLFTKGSAVSERIKEYGLLVDELHIVVFALKSLKLKQRLIAPNVWVYPTNSISRFLYISDAVRLGKKLVKEKGFVRGRSVITAQDPFESGLAGLKVKKKWRIPLEVQLHTDPFSPYFAGFLNSQRKRISKRVLKKANVIRVVNSALKHNIAGQLGIEDSKLKVLPIYVDQERIKNASVSFDLRARFGWQFTILAVSRLAPEKDLPTAIKALSIIRTRFPDVGLVVVGSGPEEGKLKALSKTLGLERNIAFEGWQESLGSYYKTASVFIQTSVFEGYGLSLVEAGLSGLPVVSTPVGIATELQDEKELYICSPGNAEYFASAIIDLIENNQKRENLRMNMRHTLESKLLSKEEYLKELQKNWEDAAKKVKA